jgi:hypothetical protein
MMYFSFYVFSFFSYKIGEQGGCDKPCPGESSGTSGRRKVLGKGVRG